MEDAYFEKREGPGAIGDQALSRGNMSSATEENAYPQISDNIRKSTAQKLEIFDSIRGKEPHVPFWDIVVITALDKEQKKAYETQLEEKIGRQELPTGLNYHVFHDPPGPKIGNGGSVMVTIGDLLEIYGADKLSMCKILLLPAGGYSQRLPSASVLGKAFVALPIGKPLCQMLELQLAMFIEFPQRMSPGIFVAASDCFEFFNSDGDWTFTKPGFTALAHPSPIDIGTTHGVFALSEEFYSNEERPVISQTTCLKFIHKPSVDEMRKNGIVFLQDGKEYVYTDSVYYMDWDTAKRLHDFAEQIKPIDCEIDAYGDFLQALGPDATAVYTRNVANVTRKTASLVDKRNKIFHFLKGTQLNVLLLNESKFYHIGTTAEYIQCLCIDPVFRYESHFQADVMVKRSNNSQKIENSSQSCLIHCYQLLPSKVGEHTVLEYCHIGHSAIVGNNSILSSVTLPAGCVIPDNTFMTTVCVSLSGKMGLFVSVIFGISDNVKKIVTVSEIGKLTYFGMPLDTAMALLGVTQDTWETVSLWHARLFPVFLSQEGSVMHTIEMLHALNERKNVQHVEVKPVNNKFLSMADILQMKDIQGTLGIRETLRQKILN